MRSFFIVIGVVLLTGLILYAAGFRIFVVKPIGAVPDGRTLIVRGLPGLRFIDSPDAFCLRQTGSVTLICRGAGLAAVANQGTIVARLPYSSILDALAGTPQTDR
ncbi:hypothetical protein [Enterovirga rhinocerotis]|uniref:Uncharacterized protein n=1 Tax=Enterovirga rhinocerotis TaxID=1339210 RepID=A0A4R7BWQ6_9HYPH|nr:hypothetical protein [Enterovirga rhinocerotis]TDR90330.1 hypothetical protein EV668_3180 [Enterovirga rhinocerotis]